MEFQERHGAEEIQKKIAITAALMRVDENRNYKWPIWPQDGDAATKDVRGDLPDVVPLKAGSLVRAYARLLDVRVLHVRESVQSGESLPVEKTAIDLSKQTS
jgi:hypothetical protein